MIDIYKQLGCISMIGSIYKQLGESIDDWEYI